jgi:hypothetical protein
MEKKGEIRDEVGGHKVNENVFAVKKATSEM